MQFHYGELDASTPPSWVQEVRDAAPSGEFHLYPAGHAFLNDENLIGTYDPECAAQAWDRAVAFLHEHVR
jgi:carboxymethylenebutenolidase